MAKLITWKRETISAKALSQFLTHKNFQPGTFEILSTGDGGNVDIIYAAESQENEEKTEIYIIDAAALPAEYYLRESVQAAILDEIGKDYKKTNQLPAGASLKNEVEARSGETEKISDQKNDSVEPGTGPENPESGSDNGSETGRSDTDTSGRSSESDRDSQSESSQGPSK